MLSSREILIVLTKEPDKDSEITEIIRYRVVNPSHFQNKNDKILQDISSKTDARGN